MIKGNRVTYMWADEAEDITADERAALLEESEEEHDCAQDDDYR